LNDPRLTPVTPEFCRTVIKEVSTIQRDLKDKLGTTFAFLGDEIYLKAGRNVPSRKHYGDSPQIEDGVGMVRGFANQFDSLMRALERKPVSAPNISGSIMTGSLFAPVLRRMIERMNQQVGTRLEVIAVENDYFGGDVSVAGLLTGGDFLAARERVRGDFAIIPKVALKSDEPIMLDGMSFAELQGQFSVPIYALDFPAFASAVKNGSLRRHRRE
jgi:NifB/MoaA-like Fe-S oxidoreductase